MKDSSGLAFNGQGGAGYSRSKTGQCVNEYSGKANDGALINKGRGPTVGNKSDKDSTYPKASPVPAFKPGKDMFAGSANPQYRGVGGTTVKKPGADAKIDMKRGPTKGNE